MIETVRLFARDASGRIVICVRSGRSPFGLHEDVPCFDVEVGERPFRTAMRCFYDLTGIYRSNWRPFARLQGHDRLIHCYSTVFDTDLVHLDGRRLDDVVVRMADGFDDGFRESDSTLGWLLPASVDERLRGLRGGVL